MKKLILFILIISLAMLANVRLLSPETVAEVAISKPHALSLHELVNQYRMSKGVSVLAETKALDDSAQAKCLDMQKYNYWSHTSPQGVKPWAFFHNMAGKMGENLAKNFQSDQATVIGWEKSPTHNANMLDPIYTEVGYFTCDGSAGHITVQHFRGDLVRH
jgi:uncharacterized protein YkwD